MDKLCACWSSNCYCCFEHQSNRVGGKKAPTVDTGQFGDEGFEKCSCIVCMRFNFSPLCIFKCVLKLSTRTVSWRGFREAPLLCLYETAQLNTLTVQCTYCVVSAQDILSPWSMSTKNDNCGSYCQKVTQSKAKSKYDDTHIMFTISESLWKDSIENVIN